MPYKKDVIVALGGGIEPDGSLPEIPKNRVFEAMRLFRQKISERLIFSGKYGYALAYIPPKTEGAAMKELAVLLGADEKNIFLEENSMDTIGNAYFVKTQYLKPNNWKNIIVLTSNYHLIRARYIFKKILGSEYLIDMAAVFSPMDKNELQAKYSSEIKSLTKVINWLSGIADGNDKAVGRFLREKHPGYNFK